MQHAKILKLFDGSLCSGGEKHGYLLTIVVLFFGNLLVVVRESNNHILIVKDIKECV